MAGKKFLRLVGTTPTEVTGTDASAGAANAGDLVALDSSGRIDNSMMPTGIGADTASIQASENLAANDFVNIWNDAGNFRVRKADAATDKEAHGFVLAAVTSGNPATVYFEGTNSGVSGMTAGKVFLSASTPGLATNTAPTATGNLVQCLGVATQATAINVEIGQHYKLA